MDRLFSPDLYPDKKPFSTPLASTPPPPLDRNMGHTALNFSLTQASGHQLGPGQYTFQFEIDPRNPNSAPSDASGQPDTTKNLVAVVPNNFFHLSDLPSYYNFAYYPGFATPKYQGKMSIAAMVDMKDVAGNPPNVVANYFELIKSAWPASFDRLDVKVLDANVRAPNFTFPTVDATPMALRAWLDAQPTKSNPRFTHVMFFSSKFGAGGIGGTDSGLFSDCYGVAYGGYIFKFYCKSGAILIKLRGMDTDGSVAHELGHTLRLGDSYADGDAQNPSVNPVMTNNKAFTSLCLYFTDGCPVDDGNYDSVEKTMSVAVPTNAPTSTDFVKMVYKYKQISWARPTCPYRWTSTPLWNYLYPLFYLPPPTGNSRNNVDNILRAEDQTTPVDLITVRGSVNADGTAAFLPFYRSTGTPPAADTPDPTDPPPS